MVCPTLEFESMELFKEDFLLTKASMAWFWEQLKAQENNDQDPKFDLLKQRNVTDFQTKTSIITAGFDPLCDEGNDYANHLINQGNEVSQLHFQKLFHGFVTFTKIKAAKDAALGIIEEIKRFKEAAALLFLEPLALLSSNHLILSYLQFLLNKQDS